MSSLSSVVEVNDSLDGSTASLSATTAEFAEASLVTSPSAATAESASVGPVDLPKRRVSFSWPGAVVPTCDARRFAPDSLLPAVGIVHEFRGGAEPKRLEPKWLRTMLF